MRLSSLSKELFRINFGNFEEITNISTYLRERYPNMSLSSPTGEEVEGEGGEAGEALLPVDDDILDVLLEDDETDAGTAFLQSIKLPADSLGVASGKQLKGTHQGKVDGEHKQSGNSE